MEMAREYLGSTCEVVQEHGGQGTILKTGEGGEGEGRYNFFWPVLGLYRSNVE